MSKDRKVAKFTVHVDPADQRTVVASLQVDLKERIVTLFIGPDAFDIPASYGQQFFHPGIPVKALNWMGDGMLAAHDQYKKKVKAYILRVDEALKRQLYEKGARSSEIPHYHLQVPPGIIMDSRYIREFVGFLSAYRGIDSHPLFSLLPASERFHKNVSDAFSRYLRDPSHNKITLCAYNKFPKPYETKQIGHGALDAMSSSRISLCLFAENSKPLSPFNFDVALRNARNVSTPHGAQLHAFVTKGLLNAGFFAAVLSVGMFLGLFFLYMKCFPAKAAGPVAAGRADAAADPAEVRGDDDNPAVRHRAVPAAAVADAPADDAAFVAAARPRS